MKRAHEEVRMMNMSWVVVSHILILCLCSFYLLHEGGDIGDVSSPKRNAICQPTWHNLAAAASRAGA